MNLLSFPRSLSLREEWKGKVGWGEGNKGEEGTMGVEIAEGLLHSVEDTLPQIATVDPHTLQIADACCQFADSELYVLTA